MGQTFVLSAVIVLLTIAPTRGQDDARIATDSMELRCNLQSGQLNLAFHGKPLLQNIEPGIGLPDVRIRKVAKTGEFVNALIGGPQLVVEGDEQTHAVRFEYRVTLLRSPPGAIFELILTNTADHDVTIPHAEPLRCAVSPPNPVTRVVSNGYIYYDPGKLIEFPGGKVKSIDSFWDAAFYMPQTKSTIVVGFLENRDAEGHILAALKESSAFSLTAQSRFHPNFTLKPGASISSGRVLVTLSTTPFDGLEFYAETSGKLQ